MKQIFWSSGKRKKKEKKAKEVCGQRDEGIFKERRLFNEEIKISLSPAKRQRRVRGGRVAFHAARKMVNIFEEKAELSSKGLA